MAFSFPSGGRFGGSSGPGSPLPHEMNSGTPLELRGEVVGVVRRPDVRVRLRVAPQRVRVLALRLHQVLVAVLDTGRQAGVHDSGERGGRRVPAGMPSRIRERPEAPHREPGDGGPVRRTVGGGEDVGQLDGVKGLPSRTRHPVGVEPGQAGERHRDDDPGVLGQLADVGLLGPALVGGAAAVEQVEDRPRLRRFDGVAGRQQQADRDG